MGGEKSFHFFRIVVVFGEMGKDQQFHMWGAVMPEQFECLRVAQVSFIAFDPFLQVIGIAAVFKHVFAVVGFEKRGVTLAEIADHPLAGIPDIGDHPGIDSFASDHKTVGIGGIMTFPERGDGEFAQGNGFSVLEGTDPGGIQGNIPVSQGVPCNVNRDPVLFANTRHPADMIGVFVRNKQPPYFFKGKIELTHSPFGFAAAETRVHQDRILCVSDIIAVGIAAGIQGGDLYGHGQKYRFCRRGPV